MIYTKCILRAVILQIKQINSRNENCHEHFYLSAQNLANYLAMNFKLSAVTEFPPDSLVLKLVWGSAGILCRKIIETFVFFQGKATTCIVHV